MITKEEWRSGDFRLKDEFKTQEGYYNEVSKFVNTYGQPTETDMIVARSGEYREFRKGKLGASWNPNLNNTRFCAKLYLKPYIYVMFVPKGTMSVHFERGEGEGKSAFEEEYVFDMKSLGLDSKRGWNNYNVGIIAKNNENWDIMTSDYETEKDFENWTLIKQPWILKLDKSIVEKFFEE